MKSPRTALLPAVSELWSPSLCCINGATKGCQCTCSFHPCNATAAQDFTDQQDDSLRIGKNGCGQKQNIVEPLLKTGGTSCGLQHWKESALNLSALPAAAYSSAVTKHKLPIAYAAAAARKLKLVHCAHASLGKSCAFQSKGEKGSIREIVPFCRPTVFINGLQPCCKSTIGPTEASPTTAMASMK